MKTHDRFQSAHRRAHEKLMKPLAAATVDYDRTIAQQETKFTGHPVKAMTINGQLLGPSLRFAEGDRAVMRVNNAMDV